LLAGGVLQLRWQPEGVGRRLSVTVEKMIRLVGGVGGFDVEIMELQLCDVGEVFWWKDGARV
jgi:hypothetical protein